MTVYRGLAKTNRVWGLIYRQVATTRDMLTFIDRGKSATHQQNRKLWLIESKETRTL
jgi:hypothetical protein